MSNVTYPSLFIGEKWYELARTLGGNFINLNSKTHAIQLQSFENIISKSYRNAVNTLFEFPESASTKCIGVLGPWNSCRFVLNDTDDLIEAIDTVFAQTNFTHVVLPYFPEEISIPFTLKSLIIRICPAETYYTLPLLWDTYENYLLHLPSKRRNTFRRETRRMELHSSSCFVAHGKDAVSAAMEISKGANIPDRHIEMISSMAKVFRKDILFFGVRDSKGLRAGCIAIKYGSSLYLRQYLTRSEVSGDGFSYFQSTYHLPINYGIGTRCVAIHAGIGADIAKKQRGYHSLNQRNILLRK